MLTAKVQLTTEYSVEFEHYGSFTYVTIFTDINRDKSYGKNKWSSNKCIDDSYCISRRLYEANKHKPFFFIDRVSREDKFEAVSSVFFKAYQNGLGWKIEHPDRTIDLLKALKDGKFERIVKNRYDNNHTLIDQEDNVIYHRIHFSYVEGQLNESDYDVSRLAAFLKKKKNVCGVKTIDIPYYNSSFSGERAVEFTYVPSQKKWSEFVAWYYPDSIGSKFELYRKIGVCKYKR